MGSSRDTFYRVRKAYENGGLEELKGKSRRKADIKNRVSEEVETAIVEFAVGRAGIRAEASVRHTAGARGVHRSCRSSVCLAPAWIGDIRQAPAASGRVCGQDGRGLTGAQLRAIEKAKGEKINIAHGEIETEHVVITTSQHVYAPKLVPHPSACPKAIAARRGVLRSGFAA